MKALLKKLAPSFLFQVECNICGSRFRQPFAEFGDPLRPNDRCWTCGSLERHRAIWKYLNEETDFLKRQANILHIAPEPCIYHKLEHSSHYYPGDLFPEEYGGRVQQMDLTSLSFEDNFFDLVMCNHVLEHIPDDRKAMRELYRVLKPGGVAIVLVPRNNWPKPPGYNNQTTYEDASITTPEDRYKAFGQSDHVRIYGLDYKERLGSVGFRYSEFRYKDRLSAKESFRLGVSKGDNLQFAFKE